MILDLRPIFRPEIANITILTILTIVVGWTAPARADADLIYQDPQPVWLEAYMAYSYIDLGALSYKNLFPPGVDTQGSGGAGGVAAGLAFDFFTVGARFTGAGYSDFGIGTLTLEGGVRLRRIEIWELYTRAGAGYAWMMGHSSNELINNLSIDGWTIMLGIGFNVYASKAISVGVGFDFSTISLSRPPSENVAGTNTVTYSLAQPGSAGAIQLNAELVKLTVHL